MPDRGIQELDDYAVELAHTTPGGHGDAPIGLSEPMSRRAERGE